MKKTNKVNPLTHFNNTKAAAIKKAGGEMSAYKKSLKKAQYGYSPGVDPSTGLYSSDRPVYAGPFEQKDAEYLEGYFPSKGRESLHPLNAIARANNERLTRESDFFNEGRYTEQKKGGSVKRKKK
jgi:hypothetical protein